jgi:hypothetical protein
MCSLLSLSVLRDRSVSLQEAATMRAKIVGIVGVALGSLGTIAVCGVLSKELATVGALSHAGSEIAITTSSATSAPALAYCPAMTSYLIVCCCIFVAFGFVLSVFHLLSSLWLIYHRLVFLSPPPGRWDDPSEISALNWICTDMGDVIPTIYMLPPSVHRQHREVNMCMLYSHGNAMDLVSAREGAHRAAEA